MSIKALAQFFIIFLIITIIGVVYFKYFETKKSAVEEISLIENENEK